MRRMWSSRLGRWVAVPLVATAVIGGAAACGDTAGPEEGTTFEDVVNDDSDRLLGETVTLSAEVDEVVAPRAFLLGDDTPQQLLVVSAPEVGSDLVEDGQAVQVTGTVREYAFTEVESDFDLDLDVDFEYEEENYLVAEEVAPSPPEPDDE